MVALDLTTARAAAETLMVDACTITLDAQGGDDDTLDQNTGHLTSPNPDTTSIYTGKCHFHASANVPRIMEEGGVSITTAAYEATIPSSAGVPPPGAVFTLTACAWDAAMVGRSWRVKQTVVATFNLRRALILEERT